MVDFRWGSQHANAGFPIHLGLARPGFLGRHHGFWKLSDDLEGYPLVN